MAGEYLPPVVTVLKGDIGDLASTIEQAKALIKSLKDAGTNIPVNIDVNQAGLAKAKADLTALKAAGGTVPVNIDLQGAGRAIAQTKALDTATTRTTNPARWVRWLGVIHNVLTIFGANLAADLIGIGAFAIGATTAFAPVVEAVGNLGQTYAYLNPLQKQATVQISNFIHSFQAANQAGIFATFTQLMNMVKNSIGRTGGIMDQASQAFQNFAAMLKVTFGSSAWQQVFSRNSGVIQQDMTMLFRTITNVLNLIPALFHDFNGLGLAFLSTANFVLHLVAVVGNAHPALMRFMAVGLLVARAWNMVARSRGWMTVGTAIGTLAKRLPSATGAFQNFQKFGLIPTLGFMTGLDTFGLVAAGGIGVLAGAMVAYYLATRNSVDPTSQLIHNLAVQTGAVGDNIAGYQRLSAQLGTYRTKLAAIRTALPVRGGAAYALGQLSLAQQKANSTAQTLTTNLNYLQHTYGLSRMQAYQLAKATGTNLKQGFTGSSTAAKEARSKIQAYEQTVQAAQHPLTALAYTMGLAANASMSLDDRVTALGNAFNVLLGPLANVLQNSVTWKNDLIQLVSALNKSKGATDLNTAAGRRARMALGQAAQATITLSQNILQQTGSVQKAMGPLQQMINALQRTKNQSAATRAVIHALQMQIDALHSKTISITVNRLYHGGSAGHPSGLATGTVAAPPGWAWVGERGKELMHLTGGETVLPHRTSMNVARAYAQGTGAPSPGLAIGSGGSSSYGAMQPIVVYVDGKKLFEVMQGQTFGYNVRTNNRTPRGRAVGRVSPR